MFTKETVQKFNSLTVMEKVDQLENAVRKRSKRELSDVEQIVIREALELAGKSPIIFFANNKWVDIKAVLTTKILRENNNNF